MDSILVRFAAIGFDMLNASFIYFLLFCTQCIRLISHIAERRCKYYNQMRDVHYVQRRIDYRDRVQHLMK